ncbi:4055_t:CDS:10 [Paraglomus brasilianum]|uniref:DNA-(apurinic or apyrimidinic site) lyase n=1 Tax=Paraglomus brasilianum TaxID=144538 RepID=A0A9N8Z3P8_9GLOM|nr:4055_t:CDS:10 [Paraglomus brasilianum]
MPELPEVETVRQILISSGITNQTIQKVEVYNRMTGKYFVNESLLTPEQKDSTSLIFQLGNGQKLIYCDARRFGSFRLQSLTDYQQLKPYKDIGIDLLNESVDAKYLFTHYQKRKISIKIALLEQDIISGIGNIYASEVLFDTKIHPLKKTHELTYSEVEKIISSAQSILKEALKLGGTSAFDFINPLAKKGDYQTKLKKLLENNFSELRIKLAKLVNRNAVGTDTLDDDLCEVVNTINNFQTIFTNLEKEKDLEKEEEESQLLSELTQIRQEKIKLGKKLTEKERELKSQTGKLKNENTKPEVEQLEKELKALKEKKDELNEENIRLTSEKNILDQENLGLRNENETLIIEKGQLIAENEGLQTEIGILVLSGRVSEFESPEFAEWQQLIQPFQTTNQEQIRELELKIEKLNDIARKQRESLDSQQTTIEEQNTEIQELNKENEELDKRSRSLTAKVEELEKKLTIKEIGDELNQMIDKNRTDQAEAINDHETKIEEGEKRMNDMGIDIDAPVSPPPTLPVSERFTGIEAHSELVEKNFIEELLNQEENSNEEKENKLTGLEFEELEKIADDTTSQNPETDERELVAEENSQSEVAVGTYPEEVEKIASGVPVEEMKKLLKEYEEKSKQEMDELRRVIEEQDKELKRRREQKTDQSSQQNEESKENNEEDHAGKLIKNAEEALSQARRSLASTPVEELNGFNFPSVAGNEGNNHSCPKCGANSNPEANSDKSKRSHSRSSSRNSFRRSGSFDVSESFQKIAQLKEQLKAQENEVVSLNTRCAALEGEKIRLEEELERVNDNRSTKAHHSRETSNDTDISGTLEPNDFNPDDKDRKIVDLQSDYAREAGKKAEAEAFLAFPELINEINDKSKELVFIPVNNPDFHWSLLVYETNSKKFYHFDSSLKGVNYEYAKPLVQDLLKQIHQNNEVDLEQYLVKKHDIKQGNGHDCGVARVEEVLGIKNNNDEKQEQPLTSPEKSSKTEEELEKELATAHGKILDLEIQLAASLRNELNGDEGEDGLNEALNEEIEARQKAEDKVETLETEIAQLKADLAKTQKPQQTAPKPKNQPKKNNAKPTKSPADLKQQSDNKNQELTEAKIKAKELGDKVKKLEKRPDISQKEKLKRNLEVEKEKSKKNQELNKNSATNTPKTRTNQPAKRGQNSETTRSAGSLGQKKSPTQQIKELNNQLSTIQQERDAAQAAQTQAENERDARPTAAELADLKSQKDGLAKQLTETQQRNKELEAESKSAEALQDTIKELTAKIQELESHSKKGTILERKQLQDTVARLQLKIVNLKGELAEQQVQNKFRQSAIRNGRKTTEEINNLNEDLSIDRQLNQIISEENENLQDRNNELAGQLINANQQIEALKKAGEEALNLLSEKEEQLKKIQAQTEKTKQNQQKPTKTSS